MEIHKALLVGMNRKNLRQSDVANKLGVARPVVHNWVTGNTSPTGENLVNLINFLEIHDLIFPEKFAEKKDKHVTRLEIEAVWYKMESLRETVEKMQKQLDELKPSK